MMSIMVSPGRYLAPGTNSEERAKQKIIFKCSLAFKFWLHHSSLCVTLGKLPNLSVHQCAMEITTLLTAGLFLQRQVRRDIKNNIEDC